MGVGHKQDAQAARQMQMTPMMAYEGTLGQDRICEDGKDWNTFSPD